MKQSRVLLESAERLGKGRGALAGEAPVEAEDDDAPFGARR
jgi:hypothetical protein